MRLIVRGLGLGASLALAACATTPIASPPLSSSEVLPPSTAIAPPSSEASLVAPAPATALLAGVQAVAAAAFDAQTAVPALRAFRSSCPKLTSRQDGSGLTQPSDWLAVCSEAARTSEADAARFFANAFDWVQVSDGNGFATGYFEPEIAGVRARTTGFDVPVYGKPASLVRCTRPDGKTARGRIDETGACGPYFTRAEIETGALTQEVPIAWVKDPIDLFFLQIQGSGRLRGPDGSLMRIGYADQNGHPYVAIGKVLRDRGILPQGGAGMAGITAWMRTQPDGGASLMRENPSYVFFKELTGPGPLGALGVAVTPQVSVAADPAFVPLGAPIFMAVDSFAGSRLWVVQDTGGAIKGANRFDTFWGTGDAAKEFAGHLSSKAKVLILLPKGSAARLAASGAAARP